MSAAALTTAASAVAQLIAAMPSRSWHDCQEQDLAVADVCDMLIEACEGNGDACNILRSAVEDIRATVNMDRQREAEAA